jgi:hypothetical protein
MGDTCRSSQCCHDLSPKKTSWANHGHVNFNLLCREKRKETPKILGKKWADHPSVLGIEHHFNYLPHDSLA